MSAPAAEAPARAQFQGLFIDGRWRETEAGTPVLNPATEQAVVTAPWGSVADADAAVSAARRAFDEGPWPRLSPADRSVALQRLREVLADWADDIVALVVAEAGIPVSVARASQFDAPMQLFDFFVERCTAFQPLRPLPVTTFQNRHGATVLGAGVVQRSPRGVVTAITPFNAPFFVNLLKVGPALAAGCTVVLKPAAETPLTALAVAELLTEAGFQTEWSTW